MLILPAKLGESFATALPAPVSVITIFNGCTTATVFYEIIY
jgi:hypothetical protein